MKQTFYILMVTMHYHDGGAAAGTAGCFESEEAFHGLRFRRSLSASR